MSEKEVTKKNPKAFLNGEDPKVRAKSNEQLMIQWLYHWGISTESVLSRLTGTKYHSNTVDRLFKRGYISKVETHLLEPRSVFRLTPIGLEFATQLVSESNPYPEAFANSSSIVSKHIRHDIFSQAVTCAAINRGIIIGHRTPRQIDFKDIRGKKIQDVIWIEPTGEFTSIEIEFTQKWEKRLDNFIARIFQSLQSGECQNYLIIFNSILSLKSYEKSIKTGKATIWISENGSKLRYYEDIRVEQDIIDRIQLLYVNPYAIKEMLQKANSSAEIESWLENKANTINIIENI